MIRLVRLEEPSVCSPVACRQCGKTTWSGCGRHVDQVMAHVPAAQRCTCAPPPPARRGWFGRLGGGR